MNRMLPIEPFDAQYHHTDDVELPEWRPCRIVGIGPSDRYTPKPYFIGVAAHAGKTFPIEAINVMRRMKE